MPYAEVPAFIATIRAKVPTTGRLALELHILAAARPGEVRKARWAQVDPEKGDWNRPAEIMKGVHAPAHTVTLSPAAVDLLKRVKAGRDAEPDDLIFPGQKGKVTSDMMMTKVLRDMGLPFHVHGFRSSFRDWAAEKMPHIPDAVAEAAIAHIVPDKVVRAYKRTNFIEMRRTLLAAWGEFVISQVVSDRS